MNHPARATDPTSSHESAVHLIASGKQRAQHAKTERAVKLHPGVSSMQLAKLTGLDRHMLARRLPELARSERVWRGPKAPCPVSGTSACTWWPVARGQNLPLEL